MEIAEAEVAKLKLLMDIPFPPDQSVVLYNLPEYEDESEYDMVSWLCKEVLGANVTIVAVLRSKPRDEKKLGVVKVQLEFTAKKNEVLRAKKKVKDHEDTADMVIRSCESHDARVNRLNSKL